MRKLSTTSVPMLLASAPATVLLAVQDQAEANALRELLEEQGYGVLAVHTTGQALAVLAEHPPHLLVADAALARANEYDLCRAVKIDNQLGFMPLIVMLDDAEEWWPGDPDYDADALIRRPADGDELSGWLYSLLRVKRQTDRLLEENRRLVETARSVEVLKADIINNVRHELSTPLLQLKSSVSLLLEDLAESSGRDRDRLAEMAEASLARMESAVESVKQLVQSHNIRLDMVIVADAIDSGMRYLERAKTTRDVLDRVELRIDPDLPPVLADKLALGRLLQVLIENALKFSPPESPVYVLARYDGHDEVWMGVQDFGIGIAEEEHEHIFDAFYQVERSSTRRYSGLGTGLALALLLARGMQTTIGLDSVVNEGSTFYFRLPVVRPGDDS